MPWRVYSQGWAGSLPVFLRFLSLVLVDKAMRALPILLGLAVMMAGLFHVEAEMEETIIVINEVLYHPIEGDGEWIELYNAGPVVDLEGVTLSDQDGHLYVFPSLVFPPGGYLVLRVVSGVDRGFENDYAMLHMGLSTPILNNAGDDLLLEGYGGVLDFLCYGKGPAVDPSPPEVPWEACAQTASEGLSLSLQPSGMTEAEPNSWKASEPTPGAFNGPRERRELLISEVHYNAYRDNEYVALFNPGPYSVDLDGWSLSDGEGTWVLRAPATLEPLGQFVIAQNATALLEDAGLSANACVMECGLLLDTRGSFALGNLGDELGLLDPYGRVVDAFHYGSSSEGVGWEGGGTPLLGKGRVARRQGSDGFLQDTDTAADWDWGRTFRLGQGFRSVAEFDDVFAKSFTSPDDSLWHLLSVLNASQEEITLSGFELTSSAIAEALEDASMRGVRVHIGLEGNPPGGVDDEQRVLLSRLGAAGASILIMDSSLQTAFRRYAIHHAKYVVVDGAWVVLGSENFSENGFGTASRGNRGWGVVVFSPALARSLSEVAREDWNVSRTDVHSLHGLPQWGQIMNESATTSPFSQEELSRASARLLLSPDNSLAEDGIPRILREAETSLDVEIFYVRWDWRGYANPLLVELMEAARRGVRVRLLLDGSSYNLEGGDDNDEAVTRLNRLAAKEGIPLEARLFSPGDGGPIKLHNKGFVVDGDGVFVSSINWNYHGAYENREVGLLLRSESMAAAFLKSFEEDWRSGYRPPGVLIQGPELLTVGEVGRFTAETLAKESIVDYAWDLHGDGTWDGTEPAFTFIPEEAAVYVLLLRVWDDQGGYEEAQVEIVVLPVHAGGPPTGVYLFVGVASAIAASLWFRKLRIVGEPTNKHRIIKRREARATAFRGRD